MVGIKMWLSTQASDMVISPRRGSTPRQTDWLTVSHKVTLTLTTRCLLTKECACPFDCDGSKEFGRLYDCGRFPQYITLHSSYANFLSRPIDYQSNNTNIREKIFFNILPFSGPSYSLPFCRVFLKSWPLSEFGSFTFSVSNVHLPIAQTV
jgi:hypothetical protein